MHIQQTGQGQPLVLLHGWGFNSAIWATLIPNLSQNWAVYAVDLPGHGHSPMQSYQLTALTAALAERIPTQAIWIGWSMGGLIALAMAQHQPESVKSVGLIASTPRFITAPDWPHAMPPEVLARFGEQLHADPAGTLRRFLALQLQGSDNERQKLRALQNFFKKSPLPSLDALKAGLDLLMTTDLRAHLAKTHCYTWAIFGQRDTLIPANVSIDMQGLQPYLRTICFKHDGHIPFLSNPELFMHYLHGYLNDSFLKSPR